MRPAEFSTNRSKVSIGGSEVTAHLAVVLADQIIKKGVGIREAEEISLHVMSELQHQYGGQNVYFPRGDRQKSGARDMEIYERYMKNELSMSGIVQEYGISLQWAYCVIRNVRKKLTEERKDKEQERRKRES